MASSPESPTPAAPPVISAEDDSVEGLFPTGFTDLYEVRSYRNASQILRNVCKEEFDELVGHLMGFRIKTTDMVESGGNKTKIAKAMDDLLHPLGWHETRIVGDLYIKLLGGTKPKVRKKRNKEGQTEKDRSEEPKYDFRIPNFVDGHKVDFVKGRVAFDMEWNSKDQTFDRDLYAMRAFYDCNIIKVGILLTRSADLLPVFAEIQNRVEIKEFKNKFGASTTWMGKLTYRLTAGRAGGCPILALGIKPALVSDFEDWKKANPEKRNASFNIESDNGTPST